jgi:uncharacterized protein
MILTNKTKDTIKQEILQSLKPEKEVKKIIIFGSFINSENPNDIDVAIFQDSEEQYLTLAMKYRRLIRDIARKIPIDIIPIKSNAANNSFLSEIEAGELLFER